MFECNTTQCNTLQYDTIQYTTLQYHTMPYHNTEVSIIRWDALKSNTYLCCARPAGPLECAEERFGEEAWSLPLFPEDKGGCPFEVWYMVQVYAFHFLVKTGRHTLVYGSIAETPFIIYVRSCF